MRSLPLLALCAALAVPSASAQSSLVLRGGVARSAFDTDRTETFDETYSDFYVARLDGPTDLIPEATTGYSVGVGWSGFLSERLNWGIGYDFGRAATDARSRFENDTGNRVETRMTDHTLSVDLTASVVRRLSVGAIATATLRQARITSSTVYADGSESLGGEYRLNGVYDGDAVGFEAGGLVRLNVVRRVALVGRATVPIGSTGGVLGIPLRDDDLSQGNDAFPRDFDRWAADGAGLDDGGALLPSDFTGLRLQLGVELRPF